MIIDIQRGMKIGWGRRYCLQWLSQSAHAYLHEIFCVCVNKRFSLLCKRLGIIVSCSNFEPVKTHRALCLSTAYWASTPPSPCTPLPHQMPSDFLNLKFVLWKRDPQISSGTSQVNMWKLSWRGRIPEVWQLCLEEVQSQSLESSVGCGSNKRMDLLLVGVTSHTSGGSILEILYRKLSLHILFILNIPVNSGK